MRRVRSSVLVFAILSVLYTYASNAQASDAPELISVEKIWDEAPHNAFTDLIRFHDKWYCTFREADRHARGGDGKCRVIESTDGKTWTSAALIAEDGIDLRDPKLSITPDGRLMMVMGGSVYNGGDELLGRQPRVSFSSDAHRWTPPRRILSEGHWLWRVTWHKGRAYGASYDISKRSDSKDQTAGDAKPSKSEPDDSRLTLFTSADGLEWQELVQLEVPDKPNETTLRFLPDDRMVALIRCESPRRIGVIGVSRPPFKEWQFHETQYHLGGPNFIVLPDGTMWAGSRQSPPRTPEQLKITTPGKKPGGSTTILARFGLDTYEPVLTLPSRGDSSYPGMVWHDNLLWFSYYSSHEGKASIYLAKIKVN
jgi:hypothetical protein